MGQCYSLNVTGSEILHVTSLQAVTVREKERSRVTPGRLSPERVDRTTPLLEVGVRISAVVPLIVMV